MSPTPFSIQCFPPAAVPAPGGALATAPASWVAHIRVPNGPAFLAGVRPAEETALALDATLVPVVVADLLRAGWTGIARPTEQPVVAGQSQYRGFALQRDLTIPGAAGERWVLTCLVVTDLATPFDWAAATGLLDAYAATIFAEDPADVR